MTTQFVITVKHVHGKPEVFGPFDSSAHAMALASRYTAARKFSTNSVATVQRVRNADTFERLASSKAR